MKRILSSIFLMLILTSLYAAGSMEVNVKHGDLKHFKVVLPANPTTGFQWSLKHYDTELFQLIASEYVPPKRKLIGAGGHMVYTFEINDRVPVPKISSIVFKYAQPWEPEKGTLKTVIVNFQTHQSVKQ